MNTTTSLRNRDYDNRAFLSLVPRVPASCESYCPSWAGPLHSRRSVILRARSARRISPLAGFRCFTSAALRFSMTTSMDNATAVPSWASYISFRVIPAYGQDGSLTRSAGPFNWSKTLRLASESASTGSSGHTRTCTANRESGPVGRTRPTLRRRCFAHQEPTWRANGHPILPGVLSSTCIDGIAWCIVTIAGSC